ncbi:Uncharacterised protein [Salmonella enterica subsp. enterica serovar Bovismorbificans]|uniref:Uncharacterized protein n=1 Tax=Salmonella enterica subsp. enterica serovar Bovismorbificans TaxID=58097 RepID=A0A655DXF0_SALET|nr:Uncharacterised protein [Salmonella enterica subsp. enterica serovar Bovismorbificans]
MARQRFRQEWVTTTQLRRVIFAAAVDVAAGQYARFGPCRPDAWIIRRQFFHRMFGQLTVGRELTAKHGKQRRFAVFIMDIKGIIASDRLR